MYLDVSNRQELLLDSAKQKNINSIASDMLFSKWIKINIMRIGMNLLSILFISTVALGTMLLAVMPTILANFILSIEL